MPPYRTISSNQEPPWSATQQLKVASNYAQEIKRQLALITKPLNFNHSRTRSGRLKIGYLCHPIEP